MRRVAVLMVLLVWVWAEAQEARNPSADVFAVSPGSRPSISQDKPDNNDSSKRLNLKEDPKLQTTVSFRKRYIPLKDFAKRLSELTGASISVSSEYAEEKLSLFVHDRPAWELMERAVEVLGLEWGEGLTKGSYRIVRSKKRVEEEAEYQRRVRQQRQELEKRMREFQKLARKDYLQIADEAEQILKTKGIDGDFERFEYDLLEYLIGIIVSKWGWQDWQKLWQGEPLIACYPPLPNVLALPPQITAWWQRYQQVEELRMQKYIEAGKSITYTGELFQSDTPDPNIEIRIGEEGNADQSPEPIEIAGLHFKLCYDLFRNEVEVCLAEEVKRGLPRRGGHSVNIERSISTTINGGGYYWETEDLPKELEQVALKQKSGSALREGEAYGLAQQLEWISERCEVNIVAQAFRYRLWDRIEETATNLYECLRGLQYCPFQFEYHDGYLLVRYRNAPQLREVEIPEALIQRLSTLQNTRKLTLEDYVMFASQLTPKQASYFNKGQSVEGLYEFDFEIDIDNLVGRVHALRFWASLNSNQQRNVLEGNRLPFQQLLPEQKRLYLEAITPKHEPHLECADATVLWARYFNTSTLSEVLAQATFYAYYSAAEAIGAEAITFYFEIEDEFFLPVHFFIYPQSEEGS